MTDLERLHAIAERHPESYHDAAVVAEYLWLHRRDFIALIDAARALPSAKELYEDYGCNKHALPQFYLLDEALKPFDDDAEG